MVRKLADVVSDIKAMLGITEAVLPKALAEAYDQMGWDVADAKIPAQVERLADALAIDGVDDAPAAFAPAAPAAPSEPSAPATAIASAATISGSEAVQFRAQPSPANAVAFSPQGLEQLIEMGFVREVAQGALERAHGSVEGAVALLAKDAGGAGGRGSGVGGSGGSGEATVGGPQKPTSHADALRLGEQLHRVCQTSPLQEARFWELLAVATPAVLNSKGKRPLLALLRIHDKPDLVEALLGRGADVNGVDADEITATVVAYEKDDFGRLWEDNVSKGVVSALMIAVEQQHYESVYTLLRHGADRSLRSPGRATGLDGTDGWQSGHQAHEFAAGPMRRDLQELILSWSSSPEEQHQLWLPFVRAILQRAIRESSHPDELARRLAVAQSQHADAELINKAKKVLAALKDLRLAVEQLPAETDLAALQLAISNARQIGVNHFAIELAEVKEALVQELAKPDNTASIAVMVAGWQTAVPAGMSTVWDKWKAYGIWSLTSTEFEPTRTHESCDSFRHLHRQIEPLLTPHVPSKFPIAWGYQPSIWKSTAEHKKRAGVLQDYLRKATFAKEDGILPEALLTFLKQDQSSIQDRTNRKDKQQRDQLALDIAKRRATQPTVTQREQQLLIYACSPSRTPLPNVSIEADEVMIHCAAVVSSGTAERLRQSLLNLRPLRFLFAGHADASLNGERTLAFTEDAGRISVVTPDALTSMLLSVRQGRTDVLELVFLNGCSSEALGRAVHDQTGVPWVVCWRTACDDEAARLFSVKFFQALSRSGCSYRDAYLQAKSAIELHTQPGRLANGSPAGVPKFVFKDPRGHMPTPLPHRDMALMDDDGDEHAAAGITSSPASALPQATSPRPAGIPLLLCDGGEVLS